MIKHRCIASTTLPPISSTHSVCVLVGFGGDETMGAGAYGVEQVVTDDAMLLPDDSDAKESKIPQAELAWEGRGQFVDGHCNTGKLLITKW